jgi:tetratricopeptide (TPR) repeat protein
LSIEPPITPFWPYDWQALEERLDPETIEKQGEFWLYRGLNIKRLIAFVGSGVSMAYGRVTWNEIATLHIDRMCAWGERIKLGKKRGLSGAKELLEYIHDVKKDQGTHDSEKLYTALQACEQVWRLIAASGDKELLEQISKEFDLDLKEQQKKFSLERLEPAERGSRLFRYWIKRETYDETPHVKRLLYGWAPHAARKQRSRDGHKNAENQSINDVIPQSIIDIFVSSAPGLRDELLYGFDELKKTRELLRGKIGDYPRRYQIFFQKSFLQAVRQAALLHEIPDTPLQEPLTAIHRIHCALADELESGADDESLRPVRRFALGLALDTERLVSELLGGATTRTASYKSPGEPTNEARPVNRAKIIPIDHDPLRRLTYDLGITRYMTTNYDLEVERLFNDMGFRIPRDTTADGPDIDEVEAVGPSGGRTRDLVLTERSAIDLVDFAANDFAHEFQVVHLHGRATEHHDIVVTEADYQRTYVSGTPSQQAFRQGLEVAFGGNPILFVGLGLSEGDILRPLREFMTNPGRDNRAIVALRDGREDDLKRKTFAKRAYAQYGVHVLHYGFDLRKEKKEAWLAKTGDAVKKSITDLRSLRTALETVARNSALLKNRAALAEIEKFTLNTKTRIEGRKPSGRFAQVAKGRNFESDGVKCDIEFESMLLQHVDALVCNLAQLVHLDASTYKTDQDRERARARARTIASFLDGSLRPAIERAEGAIITAALNAKLESVKNGWAVWWKNWRSDPKTRTNVVQYERLEKDPAAPVWARHFACDPSPSGAAAEPTDPRTLARGLESFFKVVPGLEKDFRTRRVFMLLGPQGAGKGNIYNSFALCGDRMLKGESKYSGQFFTTFSFSIEIASVWDALLAFLHDPKNNPNLFSDKETSDEKRRALRRLPRVDALRRVLKKRDTVPAQGSGERLLVVLNAFDILLDENGEPKNSEIRRILQLLLGPESKSVPLDIVCICRDRRIHGLYVDGSRGPRKPSQTRMGETSPFVGPSYEKGPALGGQTLTLLLSDTQSKFGDEPREEDGDEPSEEDEGGRIHSDFLSSLRSMQGFVRLERRVSQGRPWLDNELGLDFARSAGSTEYVHVLDLSDPLKFDWLTFDEAKDWLLNSAFDALLYVGRDPRIRDDSNESSANASPSEKKAALQRLFRVHLQRRRFLYTLIVAVAALAPESLTLFLKNLVPTLRGPGVSVQDRVIEAVLDFWFDQPKMPRDKYEPDPVLWEELLRHLAVITTPVTADVLALCPKVARHIERSDIVNMTDRVKLEARIATITAALDSLAMRGLVFNLQPAGSRRNFKSGGKPRYVVHRAIQRYVYRKLGSQRLEPSESSSFTLSLYTAQQRNYPRLNSASYAFIYNLVHALSGFPLHNQYTHRDRPEAAQMLRAALGVTRNLLSVGVVSRFSDFDEPNLNRSSMSGHFQHHWSIVRWLLSYAQELERAPRGKDSQKMSDMDPENPDNWLPFYRDELVWLANECGAFSYLQGQTYDAAAFYWLASRFQRNIELLRPGAQRSRLFLNDAWCSIDRARLEDAEGMLKDVYETADEEKVLRLVARGGLALIANIRGRTDLALAEYDYTIDEMQKMQRSRPLSILQRHRGDLKRHLRDRDEAEKDFVRAIETAETSGYIDLVHTTQVARVRNLLEIQIRDPSKLTEALDAAHGYAERMNIPRLLCEVLMVRAELLLKQGQSDVAGHFANRATRIATLNGLTLRKIAYLELLARVEKAQGNAVSSQRLLARTVRFARHVGYNLMIERVERERSELGTTRTTLER